MKVIKFDEAGHNAALLGMSLSYYDHENDLLLWWEGQKPKAEKRAIKLAHMPGNSGENKFLESIVVWLYTQASRGFWQEFDTYRVGMTKQSSSTMHTLSKREVNEKDFEPGVSGLMLHAFNTCILDYHDPDSKWYHDVTRLKDNLPEGYLQERMICTNYKTLAHIWHQRKDHRLRYWKIWLAEVLSLIDKPEYILTPEQYTAFFTGGY